jgi:hypothetical protein
MVSVADVPELPIYLLLHELKGCLCTEIENTPCFCEVIIGPDIPLEYAGECDGECGAAYVRLDSTFFSTNFPTPDSEPYSNGVVAYSIYAGVIRCAPVADGDSAEPPTVEEMIESANQQLADIEGIRRALQCCFEKFDDRHYLIGQYQPFPLQGGLVGGEWLITVREGII